MSKLLNFEYDGQYFNLNYDLVWSFKFLLSGSNPNYSGGFTTFLKSYTPFLTGGAAYQSLGYTGSEGISDNLTLDTESDFAILAENNDELVVEALSELQTGTIGISGALLAIGFDTTGYFALSTPAANGVPLSGVYKNSLVVRGGQPDYNLLYNIPLSSMSTDFTLLTTEENYCWLRFRLGDVGSMLYIDYRYGDTSRYISLTSLPVTLNIANSSIATAGISYTTPTSSGLFDETIFRMKNFAIEGGISTPTITSYTELTSIGETIFTNQTGGDVSTQDEHIILT